jgi:hypothetical protein
MMFPLFKLKLDWHKVLGHWTIFGWHSVTLMAQQSIEHPSEFVGREWRWQLNDPFFPNANIFRTYNRQKATTAQQLADAKVRDYRKEYKV